MELRKTIDIEIAYLTKEVLNELETCESKEVFQEIVEDFDKKKEKLIKQFKTDWTRTRTGFSWWFGLGYSYGWVLSNYVYSHPHCDIDFFPDVCRHINPDAMFAIAYTNPDKLDWFRTYWLGDDGDKRHSSNASLVRKFMNHCNLDSDYMVSKEYLGENVFLISKWFTQYDYSFYRFALRKLCYSFEEFVKELNYDLSDADLGEFDITKVDLSNCNIENISSKYIKKQRIDEKIIDLSFGPDDINTNSIYSIPNEVVIEKNELKNVKTTGISARDKNDLDSYFSKNIPFFYISDLHLCHILQRKKANDYKRIKEVIETVVSDLKKSFNKYYVDIRSLYYSPRILFLGDISSNHFLFEMFLNELYRQDFKNVVFVLGNHEYWDFNSIESAVEWYKSVAQKYGYICLNNELLIMNDIDKTLSDQIISAESILKSSKEDIIKLSENARYIILGGTGFAGCNKDFNALNGIYNNCLGGDRSCARDREIRESLLFEELYSKVLDTLRERQVIVCTHNPVKDWTLGGYYSRWIYTSGHNHRNERKINEKIRLYADNQYGYSGTEARLKYFSVESKKYIFDHYEDGIYEISGAKYQEFMDGRNISMSLNPSDDKIWMLKREGYYMFMAFRYNIRNELSAYIFDGGRKKRVANRLPEFYWDNMLKVVAAIEGPTIKFSKVIAKISEYVKSFGGIGRIHGCIVDIDGLSHLYVNPYDLKVTPYFAYDMCERIVYSNIENLIKEKCPELYDCYCKTITDEKKSLAIIKNENSMQEAMYHSGTSIYRESNLIKRFDMLRTDKILTNWIDLPEENLVLIDHETTALPELPRKITTGVPIVVGTSLKMNCGLMATVIEDFGYKNITVQFEDGVIVKNKRKDKFREGTIGYPKEIRGKTVIKSKTTKKYK